MHFPKDDPVVGTDFDVFISYARADRGPAEVLASMLEVEGYSVWWDHLLLAGQDWARELAVKIGFARRVIALCSSRWLASEWCRKEEFRAYEKEGKLIPVMIEDCQLPARLARLQRVNAVNLDLKLALPLIVSALGEPSIPTPTKVAPSPLSADEIWLEGLPTAATHFVGRDVELSTLLDAWASGGPGSDAAEKTNAVVLHAIGGAGKSALLRRFLDALEEKGFPGAAKVYGWSAYSQGSGDNRQTANAESFVNHALGFFGYDIDAKPITDPVERGRTLARLVRGQRTLLVLDGLEPLQDLLHVNEGRLKDRGLQVLITQLARENAGLLVITSRQELPELGRAKHPFVINHALDSLDERAGVELLEHLGVHGRERELVAAVNEVRGHALSISLLGTYISAVCAGDVARRDTLRFRDLVDSEADTPHDRQARRAKRIMDAYVERFEQLTKTETAGQGDPERLILSLVGLFDRPAEPAALRAVLAAPPIRGLTDGWHALSEMQQKVRWTFALKRLRALKLVATADTVAPRRENSTPLSIEEPGIGALDAHPIVRQHFGVGFRESQPKAFREANRRLYEHYRTLPVKEYPDTLQEMVPLLWATVHGCAASLHEVVFNEIYWKRIIRGDDEAFLNRQLGAHGAFLACVANFFDPPWKRPFQALSRRNQASALDHAGTGLRAVGRLREALGPFTAAKDLHRDLADWDHAASNASSLSRLQLLLGDLADSVATARESVAYADQGGGAHSRVAFRTTLADALHKAGQAQEAMKLYAEAEREQMAVYHPDYARLFSMQGYRFCDLLLDLGRYDEVIDRATYALEIATRTNRLLDMALHTLTLGRATHMSWQSKHRMAAPELEKKARIHLHSSVESLRKAGEDDNLPLGLLARAAFFRDTGQFRKAQDDLGEVYDIAEHGGMRLYLTDYHLERARLLLGQVPTTRSPSIFAWFIPRRAPRINSPQHARLLDEAEKEYQEACRLVEATGYRRRAGELQMLRADLSHRRASS